MAVAFLSHDLIQGLGDNTASRTGAASVNASADFILVKVLWGNLGPTPTISSVTYDGDSCTSVGAKYDATIAGLPTSTQMFRLSAPSTGSNTLTVTFSSATNTSTAVVESYSGVDGTTPTSGRNVAAGSGTSISVGPLTTTVADDIVSGICVSQQGSLANISTSDSQVVEINYNALGAAVVANLAYDEVTGASETVDWTTTSQPYAAHVVLIKASAGAATQTLTPSLYTNTNTFYSPTVTVGAVTLSPSLFTNANTFYSPTVTQGGAPQTLTPSLFTNSNTFYGPTVSAGAVTLEPSLYTNTQTFFSPAVTVGAVTLEPSLFTNTNVFYSPVVTQEGGAQTLAPSLFTNTNTFYAPTVSTGAVTISPSLYTNTSTFYEPTVTTSYTLSPSLFTNTQTFFSPTVTQTGAQTISPELFVNENVFFLPTVTGGATELLTGGGYSASHERHLHDRRVAAQKRPSIRKDAEKVINEVVKAVPNKATQKELSQSQEIALRARLHADEIGYDDIYLEILQEELINQHIAREEEAIATAMLMLM